MSVGRTSDIRDLTSDIQSEEVSNMPEYEFECRTCKKNFTLMLRISERLTTKITCPGCGSEDVEALMQTFVAKTAKKS
jgi:putative FmdB family regulatory protein